MMGLRARAFPHPLGEAQPGPRNPVGLARVIAAKMSSFDHYSRPRPTGSLDEGPAPGAAKPRWDNRCEGCLSLLREVDDNVEVHAESSAGARGT